MRRLLVRKLLLMLVLIPLLHMLGYGYGQHVFPQFVESIRTAAGPSGSLVATRSTEAVASLLFLQTYSAYFRQVVSGDLGIVAGVPLSDQLSRPLLNSAVLVGLALALTLLLGFPIGVAAISRRTGRVGPVATIVLNAGSSLPSYFFAAAMISLVVYVFRYGYRPIRDVLPWQGYGLDQHLILPTLALAVRPIFFVARVVAGLVEDEMQHDYMRTARSKGIPWKGLLWRHALPNVVGPVVVAIGQALRIVAGQLVVIEALFNWPGLGRMLLFALGVRTDGGPPSPFFGSPEVLATTAVLFGAFLLITDLIAGVLAYRSDPRLRHPVQTAAMA